MDRRPDALAAPQRHSSISIGWNRINDKITGPKPGIVASRIQAFQQIEDKARDSSRRQSHVRDEYRNGQVVFQNPFLPEIPSSGRRSPLKGEWRVLEDLSPNGHANKMTLRRTTTEGLGRRSRIPVFNRPSEVSLRANQGRLEKSHFHSSASARPSFPQAHLSVPEFSTDRTTTTMQCLRSLNASPSAPGTSIRASRATSPYHNALEIGREGLNACEICLQEAAQQAKFAVRLGMPVENILQLPIRRQLSPLGGFSGQRQCKHIRGSPGSDSRPCAGNHDGFEPGSSLGYLAASRRQELDYVESEGPSIDSKPGSTHHCSGLLSCEQSPPDRDLDEAVALIDQVVLNHSATLQEIARNFAQELLGLRRDIEMAQVSLELNEQQDRIRNRLQAQSDDVAALIKMVEEAATAWKRDYMSISPAAELTQHQLERASAFSPPSIQRPRPLRPIALLHADALSPTDFGYPPYKLPATTPSPRLTSPAIERASTKMVVITSGESGANLELSHTESYPKLTPL